MKNSLLGAPSNGSTHALSLRCLPTPTRESHSRTSFDMICSMLYRFLGIRNPLRSKTRS